VCDADRQPSRKKIFSEIWTSGDIQVWNIDVHGKLIRCAKVHNPAVLMQHESNAWTDLQGVQRLEIEDPEATLSTVPKQLVTELRFLESLSITWTKIKSLPSALFHLPLNSLYLQRNQIKSLQGIEKASSLAILDVSNNHLDCLPKTFGQLRSLVTLNLTGNGLHELPDGVGSLSQLKTLNCSCNKLKSLPNSLGNIIELTCLDVSTNQLTSLPESIGCLPKLEDLRVRSNQLTGLPDSFVQLNRLNSLLLRNNRFGDVPEQLSQLTSLQSLNLRENMIKHMDKPISALKYLILDHNYFDQIDVGILQCSNLQYLSLKSNNLVEVTGSINKLANIRSLDLSHNAIAEVPAGLDRLTHLRHLSLCSTKIRTIPLAVAGMPSLKTLEMDDCSELDGYLNIAYKTDGLCGVLEELKKRDAPVATLRPTPPRARPRLKTVYPADVPDQTPTENKSVPCNVTKPTVKPRSSATPRTTAPEATPKAEIDGTSPGHQSVHGTGQSPVPAARPTKPRKPPDLAASGQDDSRRVSASRRSESGNFNSPVHEVPQLETIVESRTSISDADVVATSPAQVDDLTTTRATETNQHEQQSIQDAQANKGSAEPSTTGTGNTSTAGASKTPRVKPPVKKKPTRMVT